VWSGGFKRAALVGTILETKYIDIWREACTAVVLGITSSVNDDLLQFIGKVIKIRAVSSDTHKEVWVFFRILVCVEQYFSIDHVGLELHAAFFEIRAEYA
jgi:hypothetical protein